MILHCQFNSNIFTRLKMTILLKKQIEIYYEIFTRKNTPRPKAFREAAEG